MNDAFCRATIEEGAAKRQLYPMKTSSELPPDRCF
jgi:hypothetical protein